MIFDKNSTYTAIDIANVLTSATDRYKDFDSARCTVSHMITKLGIQSVNGQKRNRYFTGLDAQKVLDAVLNPSQLTAHQDNFTDSQDIRAQIDSDGNIKVIEDTTPHLKSGNLIDLDTTNGIIYVRPEDIMMISLPPLYFYFTFRGWGCVITLRTGKRIHVKNEMHDVNRAIKKAMEDEDDDR